MPLVDLHHVTIKTQDLEATNRFYTEVLGMTFADRPPFGFPGTWFNIGNTQIHILAGKAGLDADGRSPHGSAAVDHIALFARDFATMKRSIVDHGLDWRQLSIPTANLWQIFVHDPNGVLIELNFDIAAEPADAAGPDGSNEYVAGQFFSGRS
jgi:catechol 2,3-dioxygenase-like lactoylglutathione lyase family enzyme